MTKTKIATINMGSSPSRPSSFAKGGDVDVAPGQYDAGKTFGSDTKSFTIGEKRETKVIETMGPGAYDVEKTDVITKTRIVNINMGSSPSRPRSFGKGGDVNVAPGQYDDGKTFGSDTKSFTIGEKREARIVETMGPGSYNPERAEKITRTKVMTVNLSSSPERPDNFTKQTDNSNISPG